MRICAGVNSDVFIVFILIRKRKKYAVTKRGSQNIAINNVYLGKLCDILKPRDSVSLVEFRKMK